jgi:DNA repair exonuclease SbcCD nuclease subunit
MTHKNSSPRKVAMFTDLHWGKKNNSTQHNGDCADYITWFCANVRKDKDITHIVFLGDWFENRNSVNVMTLNYANDALRELNSLGLPIYIIIGNHDLYHRENRKVFSTKVFGEYSNVTLVSEPMVLEETILLAPFMFKEEYPILAQYSSLPFWMGHFEFKNFIVTGTDRVMEHGPEHVMFSEPTYIFSGHFHKRQAKDNIVYIGNCFPMDYGDAWDDARGMCILDARDGNVDFINWEDCPKYRKVKLSDVLNQVEINYPPKCRVRCTIDTEIGYSEAQQLREELTNLLDLREFSLEENLYEKKDAIEGEEIIEDFDLSSLNEAVVKMLQTGVQGTSTIDPERLINIYQKL